MGGSRAGKWEERATEGMGGQEDGGLGNGATASADETRASQLASRARNGAVATAEEGI